MTDDPRIAELLLGLEAPTPRARTKAARKLGKLGSGEGEVAGALRRALADEDHGVRCAAAEALGRLGDGEPETLVALVRASVDTESFVREEAVRALGRIGAAAEAAIPHLRPLAESEYEDIQVLEARSAIRAILDDGGAPDVPLDALDLGEDWQPAEREESPSSYDPPDLEVYPDFANCRTRAWLCFGIGVLLRVLTIIGITRLMDSADATSLKLQLMALHVVAVSLVLIGLSYEAMHRGRNPAWGFLGLFSCLGLVGVLCLTNRAPGGIPGPLAYRLPRPGPPTATFLLAGVAGVVATLVTYSGALTYPAGPSLADPRPEAVDLSDPATFDGPGVAFRYPREWTLKEHDLDARARRIILRSPDGSFLLLEVVEGYAFADVHACAETASKVLAQAYGKGSTKGPSEVVRCSGFVAGIESDGWAESFVLWSASKSVSVQMRTFAIDGDRGSVLVVEHVFPSELRGVQDGLDLALRSLRVK